MTELIDEILAPTPKQPDHIAPGKLTYDFDRQCLSVSFGGRRGGRYLLLTLALSMGAPNVSGSGLDAELKRIAGELLRDAADALTPAEPVTEDIAGELPAVLQQAA